MSRISSSRTDRIPRQQLSGQPPVPPPNKIVAENMKQGNPISEWGLATEFGYGDDGQYTSIQGFATEISTNVGQTVDFKIATNSTNYRIDIYRLGYYGGDGARKVATIEQVPDDCADPAASDRRHGRGPHRRRQLGQSRRAGQFPTMRFRASTSPSSSARTVRKRRATSPSSCATMPRPATSSSRRPTRPGRPITNGAAPASISVKCQSIPSISSAT